MHVLRHPPEVLAFSETHHDAQITALIQQRMEELLTDDYTDMEELVFFVVLESADTVADLETTLRAPITTPEGSPLWEVIEAHDTCYELVFVLASSGYGALVFAPMEAAHPSVLALCREHAIPAEKGPIT